MPNLFSRYLAVAALTVAVLTLAVMALVVVGERAGREAFAVDGSARLEWLVEPGSAWTHRASGDAAGAGAWRTWDGKGALKGRSGASETLWLRVTLRNPGAEPLLGVLQDTEIYTDEIDLWVQLADGTWRTERAGESVAQRDRPWRQFSPAFRVAVPAGGETVVYVREVDHFYAMSRWWWWPRDADYFSNLGLETLVKGCAFGALAALLIYNLVLWLRLRFPDTGWYVGYAAAMLLFNLSETGALAVIGELVTPFWRHRVETGAMAASGLFVISFARVFLETGERLPRLDRALRLMILGWAVFLVAGLILPWGPVDLWLGVGIFGVLLTHTVLLVAAIVVWRRGLRAARFFVAAFGLLYASGLPAAITWQGDGDTSGVILGILVCSVLEMVLLSFAIADRFAQTQRRLVEETEQRRLIEETYAEELALEVRERTRELEAANADKDRMLTVIGHDLRSPAHRPDEVGRPAGGGLCARDRAHRPDAAADDRGPRAVGADARRHARDRGVSGTGVVATGRGAAPRAGRSGRHGAGARGAVGPARGDRPCARPDSRAQPAGQCAALCPQPRGAPGGGGRGRRALHGEQRWGGAARGDRGTAGK
jgi:hypothetical protein